MSTNPENLKLAPQNVAQPQDDPEMLQSEFLTKLRAQLFDEDDEPLWPGGLPATRKIRAAWEIPIALNALFRRLVMQEPMPQAPDDTALGLLNKAVTASNWPGDPSKVPAEWAPGVGVFNEYEIGRAADLFYEAHCRTGGGGGGPRDWPPGGGN